MTSDHFTPKCIGKELGWSHKQINADTNRQSLSIPCHSEKDASTPARLEQVRFQLHGGSISFGEHVT